MSAWLQKLILLQCIPKAPRRIGTLDLRDRLAERGYKVTQRTIQRNLKELAAALPELGNDGSKDATGWFWKTDAPLLQLPAMDPAVALAFKLGEQYLRPQLPDGVLAPLEPYFNAASTVLDSTDNDSYRQWPLRVRALPRGQLLKAPLIDQNVLHRVQDALFTSKQFTGNYQAPGREAAEYLFNPLGLVYRGNVIYLVATLWDYVEPRHFALHRFRAAQLLETPTQVPDGFSLDEHIRAGHFDWSLGEDIQLVAYFYRDAATILAETPLSDDQKLTVCEGDEDWFELRATVQDTAQLREWLLGWGDQVEVLNPSNLRREFRTISDAINSIYL
ncbi:MAG: WYL domain-containing protein [Anaerolineaceae bacterium]|nr:WYL domain-containing protein [Anaerolineaceae bacterium]MCK9505263.1 WYL domain-containing protein [Porticoccaceae bacterium]